ncbi:MAG: hypothetical protein FWG13_03910 [Leptospirales bacterium]|nr:hypothetical protein [Leptospirales bacterium]
MITQDDLVEDILAKAKELECIISEDARCWKIYKSKLLLETIWKHFANYTISKAEYDRRMAKIK